MINRRFVAAVVVAALSPGGLASAQDRAPEQPRPPRPSTLFRDDRPRQADEGKRPAAPRPAPPRRGNTVSPPPAVRTAPVPAQDRPAPVHPVPAPDAEGQARQLLRELFSEEYARAETSPPAAMALASEMMKQAAELRGRNTADDVASRYVLLHEAAALAGSARDHATALAAADELGRSFAVDRVALKHAILSAAARDPGDAASAAALVNAFFELVDEAVRRADLPGAAAILSQAETVARKSKSMPLATDVQKRRKELRDLQGQYRSLPEALAKLRERGEDPVSNLTAGRFYCFVAGNWEVGLPMLARSADQSLRTLAQRDLQPPATAGQKADLADAWWELSEKHAGRVQANLRARAGHWYRQALPDLAGLKRALAEKRLASVPAAPAGGGSGVAGGVTEPAARFLQAVAARLPPELLPQSSPQWNPNDLHNWLRKAVEPGSVVSGAAAEFTTASPLQRDPTTGRPYTYLRFRAPESAEKDGVKYMLEYSARVADEKALEQLARLVQGDKGTLSGTVNQCRIGGWHRDVQNGNKLVSFTVALDLKDLTFKPAPAAPAEATNRVNQGVRVVE